MGAGCVAGAQRGKYDRYAYERVIEKLNALIKAHPHLSFSAVADAISDWRGVTFHREYLTRMRKYALADPHLDTVIDWIAVHHDPKFRQKLSPENIFAQVGESSFAFYFHLAAMDDYDSWEQEVLNSFAGVYLCAPAQDRNSYLPMPLVRRFLDDPASFDRDARLKRSADIKQYIAERSILILRATPMGYYHAAEFPLSILFPPDFVMLDTRVIYEGVGIASGNSIHLFLRDCLTRVGKFHSILITANGPNEAANPHELALFTPGEVRQAVRNDWTALSAGDLAHMHREFADALGLGFHLDGNAQVNVSPLPDVQNRVVMTYAREYVYHRKPAKFLRAAGDHFIAPGIENTAEIERLISNPLAIGAML